MSEGRDLRGRLALAHRAALSCTCLAKHTLCMNEKARGRKVACQNTAKFEKSRGQHGHVRCGAHRSKLTSVFLSLQRAEAQTLSLKRPMQGKEEWISSWFCAVFLVLRRSFFSTVVVEIDAGVADGLAVATGVTLLLMDDG
jgi:hypothetical protein